MKETRPISDRTQTGLRMDRTLLKVLKGLAEYLNLSLADLVEGILLHTLEGKPAITDRATLEAIEQLREVYNLQPSRHRIRQQADSANHELAQPAEKQVSAHD